MATIFFWTLLVIPFSFILGALLAIYMTMLNLSCFLSVFSVCFTNLPCFLVLQGNMMMTQIILRLWHYILVVSTFFGIFTVVI